MKKFLKGIMGMMLAISTILTMAVSSFGAGGVITELTGTDSIAVDGGFITCNVTKSVSLGEILKVDVLSADKSITKCNGIFLSEFLKESSIAATAFNDCTKLEYVDLTGYMGTIASGTFKNCTALKKVVLSTNTSYINWNAFEGCDKDKLVIYCTKNSVAESFAKENGYKYRLITQEPYNELEDMIFDVDTYKANNSDVVSALGEDENVLYNHWIEYGIKEGRKGSKIFDAEYYIENNADVKAVCGNDYELAYENYITTGYEAGKVAIAPTIDVKGDVNGDNEITIEDANLLLLYVLRPEMCEYKSYIEKNFDLIDVNGDKVINSADVAEIKQKVLDSSYVF